MSEPSGFITERLETITYTNVLLHNLNRCFSGRVHDKLGYPVAVHTLYLSLPIDVRKKVNKFIKDDLIPMIATEMKKFNPGLKKLDPTTQRLAEENIFDDMDHETSDVLLMQMKDQLERSGWLYRTKQVIREEI